MEDNQPQSTTKHNLKQPPRQNPQKITNPQLVQPTNWGGENKSDRQIEAHLHHQETMLVVTQEREAWVERERKIIVGFRRKREKYISLMNSKCE